MLTRFYGRADALFKLSMRKYLKSTLTDLFSVQFVLVCLFIYLFIFSCKYPSNTCIILFPSFSRHSSVYIHVDGQSLTLSMQYSDSATL